MTSPRKSRQEANRECRSGMRLHVEGDQPFPLQTTIVERRDGTTGNIRRWSQGDAERCRLCRVCKASRGEDGQSQCYVEVRGQIAPGSGPLLSLL